ncbi:unnamed protein product [Amoebophrya sp. A120]|nr:unnamed protein product [Amoebophrya sp. A120]|eukprot:GSA120T00004329001.1
MDAGERSFCRSRRRRSTCGRQLLSFAALQSSRIGVGPLLGLLSFLRIRIRFIAEEGGKATPISAATLCQSSIPPALACTMFAPNLLHFGGMQYVEHGRRRGISLRFCKMRSQSTRHK